MTKQLATDISFLDKLWIQVQSVGLHIFYVILLFVGLQLLLKLLIHLNDRIFKILGLAINNRNKDTLEMLAVNCYRYVIYTIFTFWALSILGVHVAALLAGAGVVGVAIGLGAKSVVGDMIAGAFILFEDSYGVGDYVDIDGFQGTVTFVGLRITQVQAGAGEVRTIQHGQIKNITNYSKGNITANLDVAVSYDADVQAVIDILNGVAVKLPQELKDIISVSVLGVQDISATQVMIRVNIESKPMTQWANARFARLRIKEALDKYEVKTHSGVLLQPGGHNIEVK